METMNIIYLIVAFAAGLLVVLFLKKGKKSEDSSRVLELTGENSSLQQKLADSEAESQKRADEIKAKYEALLKETNAQCDKLDSQLKSALDGKYEDVVKGQQEEVDKLKKKIKSLEDEVEEYEDELSEQKSKIKKKDNNISELESDLEKSKKEVRRLEDDLESTVRSLDDMKEELEEKVEELTLKTGSLDFVQELLSAKELNTEDTEQLNANINYFESFVKGQFTDLNTFLYTTYPDLQWNEMKGKKGLEEKKKYINEILEQWAATKRKSWLSGKTTIAFVGEFSAGKTSIVNRILSQDNPAIPKLPVSTKATTAIPTYIAGGSTVSYSFIAGDLKRKIILEETFKKVSKDILDQVKGVSSLIKYFVMTYENPNLNGLSILDTPGFNSSDEEDKERTIDVINECDALFWVFDVNAGTVNRSSISIIKEKLNKPLYVVINKVDTKAQSEVDKVETLIKKTLSEADLQVQQFIRFSSKSPLSDIMNPIKGVNRIAYRDTFVFDVGEDIKELSNIFNKKVQNARAGYDKEYQEGENLTGKFVDCLKALRNDCETAAGIPKWVEHMFSKDRFEMSASEGKRLMNVLERIADSRVQSLAEKFDERVEKAGEIQRTWSDLCDLKAAWQKIEDCHKQYKKIIQKF